MVITKEKLQTYYVDLMNSPKEVAKILKTKEYTVRKKLKEFKIKLREEDKETAQSKKSSKKRSHQGLRDNKKSHKAIRLHNKNETDKHLRCKTALSKALAELNRDWWTEVEICGRIADVLDNTMGNWYELESEVTKDTFEKKELFNIKGYILRIIDLKEVPDDWEGMKAYFKKIV